MTQIGKLALVLPRYGEKLGGGAEALSKALVEHAVAAGIIGQAEVWTTCARDHRTWANELPAGESIEGGLRVLRFPVDERNLETFIGAELAMQQGRVLTLDEQLEWLANSVNSRALYQHIAAHGAEVDALLFAPYLFATSFWGALICPEKSLIIPCLHDEQYAYQAVFRALFAAVRGVLFNTEAEGELARKLFPLHDWARKSGVVGMGFEECDHVVQRQEAAVPYLLYSGRKEQGKNLDLLLRYFAAYRERAPESALELRLIGAGEITFCETLPTGVVDLGFVSEEEKSALMAGALALVQPSRNESFSIVLMEAWQAGTPVIVHAQCPVTRQHAIRSGGGLYFANENEFVAVVEYLVGDRGGAVRMGEAGRQYVREEYCWEAVLQRLRRVLERCGFGEE